MNPPGSAQTRCHGITELLSIVTDLLQQNMGKLQATSVHLAVYFHSGKTVAYGRTSSTGLHIYDKSHRAEQMLECYSISEYSTVCRQAVQCNRSSST